MKRAWNPFGSNSHQPICKLDCICDPKVRSNIAQASAVKQESHQEQKVTKEQAFGIGGALAIVGALLAIGEN